MMKSAIIKDHIFPYRDAVTGATIAFFAFSLIWLCLAKIIKGQAEKTGKSGVSVLAPSEDSNNFINKELKRADSLSENYRLKMETENKYLIHEGALSALPLKPQDAIGIDRIDSANPAAEVSKDLEGLKSPEGRLENPADELEQSLAVDQWQSDYDRKYQRLYVKKFLDNAQKAGYEIRLSENLEVLSIQPIQRLKALRIPQSK